MLFAIDIGNSNIVLGCMDTTLVFGERLSTNTSKTELGYAIDIKNLFEMYHIKTIDLTGCIISSVVPQLTGIIKNAVYKITGLTPLIIGPGVKTGLDILIDNPAQLGSDIVVDAVAALLEYEPPMIIIDMGTATTISVINNKGQFLGGAIMPGVKVSLDSLVAKTSQLQNIGFEAPNKVIGRNTIDSMKSGIIFGSAASIDGIIDRIEEELGQKVIVIATGGLAVKVLRYCRRDIILEKDLLLKGLREIYQKNMVRNKK